jgi:hypothetical protein
MLDVAVNFMVCYWLMSSSSYVFRMRYILKHVIYSIYITDNYEANNKCALIFY